MITYFFTWMSNNSPWIYLTQSLWRDEAFAVLLAEHSPNGIIRLTAADYNPPLHYLLLHYWMIVFGRTEISLRMLSLLFFLLFLIVVYRFSLSIVKKKLAIVITLFAAFNPMLLYYAFEVRMYSMFAFFALLSTVSFYKQKWGLYIIASLLGLYTHSYMPFILATHILYETISIVRKDKEHSIELAPFLGSLLVIGIGFSPWVPVLFSAWIRSRESWIYPVDMQAVQSSLGNLFVGYEGTPNGWWGTTAMISLCILIASVITLRKKPYPGFLFFLLCYVPLGIVLGISFIKPIFVNRYVIFVSVSEVFLLSFAVIYGFSKNMKRILTIIILLFLVSVNFYRSSHIKKLDLRSVYVELNTKAPFDTIILTDPLVFFEGKYYANNPSHVFIYKAPGSYLPSYLGNSLFTPGDIIETIPNNYPVYFVDQYGTIQSIQQSMNRL